MPQQTTAMLMAPKMMKKSNSPPPQRSRDAGAHRRVRSYSMPPPIHVLTPNHPQATRARLPRFVRDRGLSWELCQTTLCVSSIDHHVYISTSSSPERRDLGAADPE